MMQDLASITVQCLVLLILPNLGKKGCNKSISLVVSEWDVEDTSEGTRLDSIKGSDECSSLGIYE